MTSGGRKRQQTFRRWLDECKIACSGIILATREMRFVLAFVLAFVIFGTLMNLLSGSTAALSLFWSVSIPDKCKIIFDAFLANFGVGRSFLDWLQTFIIVVLQSILIALVVLVWQKRRRSLKEQVVATATNADNLQNVGLAAGLAVLGTGCPTCGTTLLAPLISTLFSTSSFALASFISNLLTLAALIVVLLALKRVGGDAYAMLVSERYLAKHSTSQLKTSQEEKS